MWIFDSVTMLKEATYPQLCGNMVAKHLLICLSKRFKHHHRPPHPRTPKYEENTINTICGLLWEKWSLLHDHAFWLDKPKRMNVKKRFIILNPSHNNIKQRPLMDIEK